MPPVNYTVLGIGCADGSTFSKTPTKLQQVNISLNPSIATKMYFNCPGSESGFSWYNYILYALVQNKSSTNAYILEDLAGGETPISLSLLKNGPVGKNINTGLVTQLPGYYQSIKNNSYYLEYDTSESGNTNQPYRYCQIFDKFPGAYVGNNIYSNMSIFKVGSCGSDAFVYFPANFSGIHTYYFIISQGGNLRIRNFSLDINEYTISGSVEIAQGGHSYDAGWQLFKNVNATNALKIIISNYSIQNMSVISLPKS